MKGWLRHSPLPEVKVSLAGQETITEKFPGAFQSLSLLEQPVVGDQDITNGIRMIQQEDLLSSKPKARNISISTSQSRQVCQWVSSHGEKLLAGVAVDGPRRHWGSRDGRHAPECSQFVEYSKGADSVLYASSTGTIQKTPG